MLFKFIKSSRNASFKKYLPKKSMPLALYIQRFVKICCVSHLRFYATFDD